jgi:hypothetical protein
MKRLAILPHRRVIASMAPYLLKRSGLRLLVFDGIALLGVSLAAQTHH